MLHRKIIDRYKSFSVITKFLIPQVITLIFGIFYIVFTYQNISSISNSYSTIKEDIIPSIEKSTKNIMLLRQLANDFTFATLSLEDEFLESTQEYNKDILNNLNDISKLAHIDTKKYIDGYNLYFSYTYSLVNKLIKVNEEGSSEDMAKVVYLYNENLKSFKELNSMVKSIVSKKTTHVYNKIESFHTNIILFGIGLYLFLSLVTLLIYKGLQKSFKQLISDISDIRQSGLIKQKLAQFSKNEFGIIGKELNAIFEDFNQAYQNVVDIANRDKLTQLYNRVYMDKQIDELIEKNEPFSIAIVDIDHFKKVNDTYGHITGDKVLQSFAKILKDTLKDKALVCRWGGEEFLIVVPNCNDKDRVYKMLEELRGKIESFEFPDISRATASFGSAIFEPNGMFKDTMHRADKALYRAKESGRNRVVVADD